MAKDRIYFPKRSGLRWEVWFKHYDGSADPTSGATEWKAVWGIKFWRKINAMRIAGDLFSAYSDGAWLKDSKK